jgi:cytochrome-b5 reductase
MTEFVTHDVKRYILSKPHGFDFEPGQGVKIMIDEPEWREDEDHPFTPTSLRDDSVLEFIVKMYPGHKGFTNKLQTLEVGTKLLLTNPFGTIVYKGPGVFLAAGSGVTPFLAIFRHLANEGAIGSDTLLFSNKTPADVICEKELRHYFQSRCILTCTRQSAPGYENRRISAEFLKEKIKDFNQHFYVCGPDAFVEQMMSTLKELGVSPETLVFEE